ncbi:MAG TPA: FAD-dependent oxidoreductase [Deltaproteobacteria bacterium]|nr:FAD-dependent oxidoreductase [Deltaproteobacteria bacterium]HOM28271.1 FAD-dependent oxidoreductase [Deltaproteobacteria bacterium]
MSADTRHDLIVIGGGPAGYTGALLGAKKGLKVCIVEQDRWGGTCTNKGCIPTKAYMESLRVKGLVEKASRYGIEIEGAFQVKASLEAMRKRTERIVKRLAKGVEFLLAKAGVTLIGSTARLEGARRVAAGGRVMEASAVLIATGARPRMPASFTLPGFITSDEVFDLERAPTSLVIVGAGAVGMEMAHIFSRLGTEVVVLEEQDRVLPLEDEEVSRLLASRYREVRFVTGARILPPGPVTAA